MAGISNGDTNTPKKKQGLTAKKLTAIFALVASAAGTASYHLETEDTIRVNNQNGAHIYIRDLTNEGVYIMENVSSAIHFKSDEDVSALTEKIQDNCLYNMKSYGWNVNFSNEYLKFLNQRKNVTSAEKINCPTDPDIQAEYEGRLKAINTVMGTAHKGVKDMQEQVNPTKAAEQAVTTAASNRTTNNTTNTGEPPKITINGEQEKAADAAAAQKVQTKNGIPQIKIN